MGFPKNPLLKAGDIQQPKVPEDLNENYFSQGKAECSDFLRLEAQKSEQNVPHASLFG